MILKEYCPVCDKITKCKIEKYCFNTNTVCKECGYIIDMDCQIDYDNEIIDEDNETLQ